MRNVLVVALLTSTAAAAPSAELDGKGGVRIDAKTVNVGITKGTVTTADVRGVRTVVVQGDREGVVLQLVGGAWKEIARAVVGGSGLDADFAYALDARPEGVYRYQARPGYKRCDNGPAYLFAEGLTGGKFVRLTKLPTGIPDDAPVIAAKPDVNPSRDASIYRARVASHQPGAMDAGTLAIPAELDDGKPATTWREDLVSSAGEGQFFTYQPRVKTEKAAQVRIVTGPKGSNRPQRIGVATASGAWHIDVPDGAPGSAFVADLPTPVHGCVTLVLESTYGPEKGTTQIAELVVYAQGERAGGGEAALAHSVAEGADARVAAQELARRGAAGVKAIDDELAKTKDHNARARLFRAAIAIKDPAAGPLLARAAVDGEVQGADLVAAITALSGLGQGQELHALAMKSGLALDARVAAVRALTPDKDRELLISLAGQGPREVRQATIESLIAVDAAVVTAAAQAATKPSAAGDLWRAVTRHARHHANERAAAVAAMSAAITQSTDYERRYRLVDGIATLGDANALKALGALLAGLPDDPDTAAYKQVVARAIATTPRPDAFDLIVSLTSDRDAGVRLAALSALAGASGGSEGAWHGAVGADGIDRVIQTSLFTDTWPEIRRFAAQMLGDRCVRPGPAAALKDSLARDRDLNVRGDALTALVQCKAGGSAELLAKLWDDTKAPLELRRRAVDLTVALGDAPLGAKLVAKFTQWRGAAIESEQALALSQNAAYAVGQLNPPGTAAALMAALEDAAFPEIVAAAATGLGLLRAACPANARVKLQALAESDEQQIAIAAKRAAAQCGR